MEALEESRRRVRVLPPASATAKARSFIVSELPAKGLGCERTVHHIRHDLTPGFNRQSQSPNYYGFVTGGATPAAVLADNIVTEFDQNVQVHLPNETVATEVEHAALTMLCQLIRLEPAAWEHKTFTTGATASNVLGLACGREWVCQTRSGSSVAELGLLESMQESGIQRWCILTTEAHSSLRKAASLVGFGRNSVIDVGSAESSLHFDFYKLANYLADPQNGCIVVISCGEVNTGRFATDSEAMQRIRGLCNQHRAWVHVDGAFGIMARMLDPEDHQMSILTSYCGGIDLADSITGDCHKLLNVPYDCGFFLSRDSKFGPDVFRNVGAAYLGSGANLSYDLRIKSPLNIGIENSRRFRALPVYSTLLAYGADGYREMLYRQISLARSIAGIIRSHDQYELLPAGPKPVDDEDIYIVVLFRAVNRNLNPDLVRKINATGKIYVSGTQWESQPAARFAVSNWQVDVRRDTDLVKDVLDDVCGA